MMIKMMKSNASSFIFVQLIRIMHMTMTISIRVSKARRGFRNHSNYRAKGSRQEIGGLVKMIQKTLKEMIKTYSVDSSEAVIKVYLVDNLEAMMVVEVIATIKGNMKYFSLNLHLLIYTISLINSVNKISNSINIKSSHMKQIFQSILCNDNNKRK